jgi:hypothetical protein
LWKFSINCFKIETGDLSMSNSLEFERQYSEAVTYPKTKRFCGSSRKLRRSLNSRQHQGMPSPSFQRENGRKAAQAQRNLKNNNNVDGCASLNPRARYDESDSYQNFWSNRSGESPSVISCKGE